mgnify:CR=1 FL=1
MRALRRLSRRKKSARGRAQSKTLARRILVFQKRQVPHCSTPEGDYEELARIIP